MSSPPAYLALALQTTCFAVNEARGSSESRERMHRTLERVRAQILAARRFIGADLRLVVLPEYFLTGFPLDEDSAAWAEKGAIDLDGAEYASLGCTAAEAEVYLAGNAYERDPHFPGLYFQTSFLIEPAGRPILRYRRLLSLFGPTPYDVWDRYIEIYGAEAVFPVASTPIGRIAAIASEEILYPDIARAFALRGAQVLVHSSSEVASALVSPKNIAKQARALENLAYVVSANSAGIEGIAIPAHSTDASSKIVDFRGLVLAEAGYGESIAACAEIDLAAQRRHRERPGMGNLLARQPIGLWRAALEGREVHPANTLLGPAGDVRRPSRGFYLERQCGVIAQLRAAGLI